MARAAGLGLRPATVADRLAAAAVAALCLMPAALVVASRSSPLVLAVAALLAAAAMLAEAGPAGLAARLAPPVTPLSAAVAAALALALASLAWSVAPGISARALLEFVAAVVGGFVVLRLVGPRLGDAALAPAAAGLLLAAALLVGSLASGFTLQRLVGLRTDPSSLNRAALALVILALPIADRLAGRGARGLALLVFAAVGMAAFRSESTTAALAWLVALATWIAVRLLPVRASLTLARLGLVAALVLAPLAGDLLARAMPDSAKRLLASANAGGRVAIARSFGAVVAEDPWRGIGFGGSARAHETPAAQRLDPELRTMLAAGHPHNAPLQVWAELGVAGAALLALTLLLTVEAITTSERRALAPRLALLAAVAAAMLVGHGAWQGWWAVVVGAAVAWASRPEEDRA